MSQTKTGKQVKANQKTVLERPGSLQSNDEILEYHTHQTIMLVKGRPAKKGNKEEKTVHPIMGLISFASRLNPIHTAAKADDPYADYYLYEVENRLKVIRAELVKRDEELVKMATDHSSTIELKEAKCAKPATFAARFKSPYAFGAAYLLKDLDNYISHVLMLHQRMVFTQKEMHSLISGAMKPFRSLFTFLRNFQEFACQRKEFDGLKPLTARAKQAKDYYESLSSPVVLTDEIMSREVRGEWAGTISPIHLTDESVVDLELESDEL